MGGRNEKEQQEQLVCPCFPLCAREINVLWGLRLSKKQSRSLTEMGGRGDGRVVTQWEVGTGRGKDTQVGEE